MNEVEKLYSLANIKPLGNADLREMKILVDGKVFVEGKYLPNNYYNIYPPFTAEKQLELIKWLMCKKQTIQVELRLYENDYCISHITECEDNDAVEYVETGRKNTFDEALAELVNELWQDLTEEERKQIKNILESEVSLC